LKTSRPPLMTVGQLSRRTGVPVKHLREYEDLGLIYTVGRSRANYRLFDTDALWCVERIRELRGLGLTVAEIRELTEVYLSRPSQPFGPHLAERLTAARSRIDARIGELQQTRQRIAEFEQLHAAELRGRGADAFRTGDPRHSSG
jgi:MerR family transcriptional regulator, copper efflux regulator